MEEQGCYRSPKELKTTGRCAGSKDYGPSTLRFLLILVCFGEKPRYLLSWLRLRLTIEKLTVHHTTSGVDRNNPDLD
jgi:hypothetical protein